ncbi:IS4 family transposase [Kineosporia babensis]|uniref:IS4 family transposase n=1 Tax=Kineosporia babensis TaxID=499548 RepID=A0A9X1NNC7_9ACTN|nr:IS4 family transposase [Kineosporia babensis]MCD5317285.1 IS4 family transposase [Kineosporia babensis]
MAVSPDQASLGVLVSTVDRDVVDAAVAAHGAGAQRRDGKLPPHVTAYSTMALCLFSNDDYEEVLQKVTGSLDGWGCWDASWTPPSASGLTQARKRLGSAVMREIFESVAAPIAGDPGSMARALTVGPAQWAFLREWRVMAIDGFEVDVPDTPANLAEFDYSNATNTSGDISHRSGYPKARVVAISECGTHAFVAAEVEACSVGERTMARRLFARLRPDELLTADRGFYSFEDWDQADATGAALLWRATTQLQLPIVHVLEDGSYLSVLVDPARKPRAREKIVAAAQAHTSQAAAREGLEGHEIPGVDPEIARLVRVIEYDVPDREGNGHGELIVLLTNILGPEQARSDELAATYHQRWEQETAIDQLKTHLRGPGKVLRSRLPDLVRQEIWAWLTVHYALTKLIVAAAAAIQIDPDRISYSRALRLVRRGAEGSAAFPP